MDQENSSTLFVQCDGASRGNPGPAAIGVLVSDARGRIVRRLGRRIGQTTNNQAEYRALIAGLETVAALGGRQARVTMDSELVVRQLKGRYRVRNPQLRPLFRRAKELIERLESFEIESVPRQRNQEADRLANQALDGTDVDFIEGP